MAIAPPKSWSAFESVRFISMVECFGPAPQIRVGKEAYAKCDERDRTILARNGRNTNL
jgi:hypothetical protein